jgi:putative membrane protein insertion efficiency factor
MPTNSNYNIRPKRRAWAGGLFIEEISENDDSLENGVVEGEEISEESADSKSGAGEEVMSESMIMAIGFYKQWISPLLPPACRFLPTCSQYGVQAIKEFGPTKGTILTAWRLARCSPFGGRGYDPPRWPPVSYTYGSY